MEYTLQEYKRNTGKKFTTTDGHKYIKSKITGGLHLSQVRLL